MLLKKQFYSIESFKSLLTFYDIISKLDNKLVWLDFSWYYLKLFCSQNPTANFEIGTYGMLMNFRCGPPLVFGAVC